MTDLKNALWCDLTTDAERSAWLLLGRGYETGVVAKSIQNDLARAYQRLAQPEQEPVAWFSKRPDNTIAIKIAGKPTEGNWEPLYIAPPQRKWQGLTNEEIKKLSDDCAGVRDEIEFIRAIEQALKEKNT